MSDCFSTPTVIYLYSLWAVLGAVLGSGLNCLSFRMARGLSWSSGRSGCVHCGHPLAPKDLIPVLSFLLLKGRCRYCGKKISLRYPAAEAVMALIFVSLLWRFGLKAQILCPLVLCCCLFCLSLVDLDTQIIPHRFLLIPALVRAAEMLIIGGIRGLISGCVPGLILGGGVLLVSVVMDQILKKDSLGGGDIKLLGLLGMFFPIGECLLLVMLACAAGIVMALTIFGAEKETPFPFGPALAFAAWFTLLFGSELVNWYLGLFVI